MAQVSSSKRLEFWRALLERQAESGLSVAAFCREESISQASFYQWRKKLVALPPSQKPRPAFVALGTLSAPERLEIEFPNHAVVRLPLDVDRGTIQLVLQAVARADTQEEVS